MRLIDTKHFALTFRNNIKFFAFLGFHRHNVRRYMYGDVKEISIGFTICNLTFSFYFKCKEDDEDEIYT